MKNKITHIKLALSMSLVVLSANGNVIASECKEVLYDEVVMKIKKEFPNKMTKKDIFEIGTNSPKLSFDKEKTKVSYTFLVPFKAAGPLREKSFFAVYQCKTKTLEYSIFD